MRDLTVEVSNVDTRWSAELDAGRWSTQQPDTRWTAGEGDG